MTTSNSSTTGVHGLRRNANDSKEKAGSLPRLLVIAGLPTPSRRVGGEVEKNRQLLMALDGLGVETQSCNVSDWRRRPFAVGLALSTLIRGSSQILISVSASGLFVLALSPLGAMLRKRRVCVMAIGGMLDQHIVRLKPLLRAKVARFLKAADAVVVETTAMATNMRQLGYQNVIRLPNFRARGTLGRDLEGEPHIGGVLRCVFLSRVAETKGIGDAVTAVVMAQERMAACRCSLDVYGPLEGVDPTAWPSSIVHYQGEVSPNKVAECLAHYDVMLFPTFHEGEGFPGVLIDAAFASLPAIVTAWRSNAEVITDGVNGYVVPVHNPEAIAEKLIYLADNPEVLMHLREGALESANRYDSAVVIPQLLHVLEQKGWNLHSEHCR